MKRPILLLCSIFSVFGLMTLQSYKDGPAENLTQSTGAPGSGTQCTSCHAGGGFGTISVNLTLLGEDTGGITKYVPGKTYQVWANVNNTSGIPSSYGIQMVVLDNSNGASSGSWTFPTDNVQLTTLSTRQYFEHKAPSASNTFGASWTAPAEGTGTVKFYIGANAVNGNNATSGDNAGLFEFSFEEMPDSSNSIFEIDSKKLSVFPNPAINEIFVNGVSGRDQFEVVNIAGKTVSVDRLTDNSLNVSSLNSGLYFIKTEKAIARFIKL